MTPRTATNVLVLIAHVPLATALARAAAHVLPAAAADLVPIDIDAALTLEQNRAQARKAMRSRAGAGGVLVLADVLGATPCNIATALIECGASARLLAGVNLPMLLRALTYRDEPLDVLAQRALDGGLAGVVAVPLPEPRHLPPGEGDAT